MIIVCSISKSNFNWEVKLLSSLSKSFAFLRQFYCSEIVIFQENREL